MVKEGLLGEVTLELRQDRMGEKRAVLGRCAERASRWKKQPVWRARSGSFWRRGKEASVAGAEGEGQQVDGRKGRQEGEAGSQAGRASQLRSTIPLIVAKYA